MLYYLLCLLTVDFCEALQYTILEHTRSYCTVPLSSDIIICQCAMFCLWKDKVYVLILMNVIVEESSRSEFLPFSVIFIYLFISFYFIFNDQNPLCKIPCVSQGQRRVVRIQIKGKQDTSPLKSMLTLRRSLSMNLSDRHAKVISDDDGAGWYYLASVQK